MNIPESRSDWQLPPGVTQGSWQYSQAPFIAEDYDAYFAEHGLLQLDQSIVDRWLQRPGVVVDLGCGTGRALLPLAARGFSAVGVDLSQNMLRVVERKADAAGVKVACVRGNLVELGFLADGSADYALCLFSTLGMIAGAENRQTVVEHVRRILRPNGLFLLHVHNFWHNLSLPLGRRWVFANLLRSAMRREVRGDKQYDYRGIRNFYLHVFTYGELCRLLHAGGFEVLEWNRIGPRGDTLLPQSRWLGHWRTQGWLVVCRPRS